MLPVCLCDEQPTSGRFGPTSGAQLTSGTVEVISDSIIMHCMT
jgi:hypothetical protein